MIPSWNHQCLHVRSTRHSFQEQNCNGKSQVSSALLFFFFPSHFQVLILGIWCGIATEENESKMTRVGPESGSFDKIHISVIDHPWKKKFQKLILAEISDLNPYILSCSHHQSGRLIDFMCGQLKALDYFSFLLKSWSWRSWIRGMEAASSLSFFVL